MNSSLRLAILKHLNDAGYGMLNSFFSRKYSRNAPIRALLGLDHLGYASIDDAKRSLSATLSRLKREGLIIGRGARKKTIWSINDKGKDYIKKYSTSLVDEAPTPPMSDGIQRLVIFDIPEKDRKERLWLRKELLACGYDSLQKSVYLGTCPLPEDVLKEIDEKGLYECVHIMSLNKLGTVKKDRKR
ncbi:MAG: CRISPR-associated endonuclease Cas2 [bacterium]|nr:CRISPR-associated endonuclease Cas2 [bacterium]